jgi:hypothetical protein
MAHDSDQVAANMNPFWQECSTSSIQRRYEEKGHDYAIIEKYIKAGVLPLLQKFRAIMITGMGDVEHLLVMSTTSLPNQYKLELVLKNEDGTSRPQVSLEGNLVEILPLLLVYHRDYPRATVTDCYGHLSFFLVHDEAMDTKGNTQFAGTHGGVVCLEEFRNIVRQLKKKTRVTVVTQNDQTSGSQK